MNQGETQSNRARETEVKLLGGLDAYRRHALANLRLKTVIKVRDGVGRGDGIVPAVVLLNLEGAFIRSQFPMVLTTGPVQFCDDRRVMEEP